MFLSHGHIPALVMIPISFSVSCDVNDLRPLPRVGEGGGHSPGQVFAALEQPEALARDVRAFFAGLR